MEHFASPGPGVHPLHPPFRVALVGRSRERAFLRDELAAAIGGHGRLVLLGGEAGIGKTALARDLAQDAVGRGVRVLAGHCYDLTNTPPYGPWLELFRDVEDDPDMPDPPVAFMRGRLGPIADRSAHFDDVQRFIDQLARGKPVLLVLEDLHWADPASIELLRHICRSLRRLPILLVATYRIDELARHHSLFQHLPDLVREGDAARLEPQPLAPDALRELVAARYRLLPADEARLVSYLTQHSDGNPFFAVELLRALEADGLLRAGGDRSTLGELARIVVPALLRQVIEGRIARLGEETRQPLAIAAVIGQEVPLALWAALSELDEEALLVIVERLVGANLIEARQTGTHVRFVHALTREAIYTEILAPRRRVWHRRVGEALAADPSAGPDQVALHFQQAGDPRAWEWLVRAGNRAQAVYAWRTAAARFRAAADLLAGIEGREQTHRELVMRFAFLVRFSDAEASMDALDDLERLVVDAAQPATAAEIRFVRGIHLCYADKFAAGLAEMLRGIEYFESIPVDPPRSSASIRFWFTGGMPEEPEPLRAEDEVLVRRLREAGFDFRRCVYLWDLATVGRAVEAAASCERFLAAFGDVPRTRGGIGSAAAFIYHALGYAYAALGRPEEARYARDQARALFTEIDHFALITFSLLGELREIELTYGAADPGARRRIAAEAEQAISRAGGAFRPGTPPRLAWLGCLLLDGRWDEASEILENLADPGNAYLRREVSAATAFLARERGDPNCAWTVIGSLLPEGAATEPGNNIHQEGLFLLRLAAHLCLDAGDRPGARSWLAAHTRWLAWSGAVLGRADGQLAWAAWHQAAGKPVTARALALEALDLATAPDQPLVQLAAHRLLGEIETGEKHHVEAAAHLAIALGLAERCDAPFERALTLLALAELKLARGENVIAIVEDARRRSLQLGAFRILKRIDAMRARIDAETSGESPLVALTPREVDVLRLLTQHRTDKEIADLLFISRHTASTHVKHVLSKLGAASRREAAELAAGFDFP